MDIGLLVLRVVVGGIFAVHGLQKLFGWFGGYGVNGTAGFFGSLRYRRPRLAAVAAGLSEAGGGLLLAAGFLTPLAGAAILGVMINAIVSAKWSQGLIGGFELDALFAGAGVALAFTGAGAYSVDAALGWDLGGVTWGLISIAIAVVTAGLVLATRVPAAVATGQAADAGTGSRAA
jgi:putative oxidoreductase